MVLPCWRQNSDNVNESSALATDDHVTIAHELHSLYKDVGSSSDSDANENFAQLNQQRMVKHNEFKLSSNVTGHVNKEDLICANEAGELHELCCHAGDKLVIMLVIQV